MVRACGSLWTASPSSRVELGGEREDCRSVRCESFVYESADANAPAEHCLFPDFEGSTFERQRRPVEFATRRRRSP